MRTTKTLIAGSAFAATAGAMLTLATTGAGAARPDPRPWNVGRQPASTAGAPTPADKQTPVAGGTRITLIGRASSSHLIDLPPTGKSSVGDTFIFREMLKDASSGAVVGHNDIDCVFSEADGQICHGTLQLDGRGKVTFDGAFGESSEQIYFAVTGGTGEFAKARGQLVVIPGNTNPDDHWTLVLFTT